MSLYRVEDTAYIDSFALPSIFDHHITLYKEWHDFVFYDAKSCVFGLLNFGVHGNPYDVRRGYGSVISFFVDPGGKIVIDTRLIPLSKLQVSWFNPDFLSENARVKYADDTFRIAAQMEKSSFDLDFQVTLPPVSNKEIFLDVMTIHKRVDCGMILAVEAMNKQWDTWLGVPKLGISGVVKLHEDRYPIHSCRSYHDHEGGRFDWDSTCGWDTGAVLCDSSADDEPECATFLFYRYGTSDDLSYGGFLVETKDGSRSYFDSKRIRVSRIGGFTGEQKIIPGITRLLYPDYRPSVPKKIVFAAVSGTDTLNITFSPKAVCSIVVSSLSGKAEVVFNEMFCEAAFEGSVGKNRYHKVIPCWFESVRPRRSAGNSVLKT